jgi:DNA-binding transcriptional LysR family regulator
MDLFRAMELFVAAVQHGSLSAAARQFRLTPTAVSRQITALEDNLGSRLLNRSSRSLSLTEAGEVYYESAISIVQQTEAAEARVKELGTTPTGSIRVHAHPFIGTLFVLPMVQTFLELYPNVDVTLLFSNDDSNLTRLRIDVGIRFGRPTDSSLLLRKIGETQRIVVASPAYIAVSPPLDHPGDLAAHSCLTFADGGATVWSFVDHEQTRTEMPVKGRFSTDFGPALRNLALAGKGLALLPEWSVHDDLQSGNLVRVLAHYDVSHLGFGYDGGIYAVYQRDRYMAVKARAFIDFLVEAFRVPYTVNPGTGATKK